ncbi:NAD(P)H-hydrate epimerase [Planctomycetes bacterium LzC2]|uniref:NAD(P)H-hydrate epimerase n=1 Tax=Alienimonas chondri TaxID=2681879 RepID=A0ABX1VML6_9PLAN|nr:NAD(P)H-hydrate epimerase [Alienimonas chondri]
MSSPTPPAPLSVAQCRSVDRLCLEEYGLPGAVLMENAARGCAELLWSLTGGAPGPVAIVCGKGNNGGDGFALARHLAIRGVNVHLFAPFPEPPTEDDEPGEAAMNARVARRMGLPWTDWTAMNEADLTAALSEAAAAGWLVDALLGTGPSGPPREPMPIAVRAIDASRMNADVLAIDVPTGFDADSGEPFDPDCCVRADHTATFVAPKTGFAANWAANWTGPVSVIDIGAPPAAITAVR